MSRCTTAEESPHEHGQRLGERGRRHFTSADLQRQLDIAIDLLVFQIEHISSSATSDEGSTRGADDWHLLPTLERLRERDPNAIVVLEAITSRLFERERGWVCSTSGKVSAFPLPGVASSCVE
jgi:hypothetical protein